MENSLYWITEYIKVLLSYGFLMYIWPSAVFRKYLKGKSLTFRFGFCTTVQVVLVSTVVLGLGLLHILNRWTMWIVFYGLFLWSFRDKFVVTKEGKKKFKYFVTGTLGWRHLLLLTWEKVINTFKRILKQCWRHYKTQWLEYTALLLIVFYGVLYFSWGPLHENVFGFGDIPVHHSWIYGLVQGKPFSAGIYPEGMHCWVYAMYALLGIRIFSCLLYIGCINTGVIIVGIYCFAKEIFQWKFSAIFALVVLLTINMTNADQLASMARLQCALPQEFGFPALYLCAAFLIRFLKQERRKNIKFSEWKFWKDENLFVFCMALAATIIIHFYTTIMAFYLCLGIAIVSLKKIFSQKRFVTLVITVFLGVVIAAIPMVVGFVSGIPLQGSLSWGMEVIKGTDEVTTETQIQTENPVVTETPTNIFEGENLENDNLMQELPYVQVPSNMTEEKQPNLLEKLGIVGKKIIDLVRRKCIILYEEGYKDLFSEVRAKILVLLSIGLCIFCIVYKMMSRIFNNNSKVNLRLRDNINSYLCIIIATIIFVAAYCASDLGIPKLIAGSRTCFIGYSTIAMMSVVVWDIFFVVLMGICAKILLKMLSMIFAVGMAFLVYMTGNYHGYLYFELTRYEATVNVVNDIMDSLPDDTYTIVATTSEIYQIIQQGRHEEWITFLQNQGKVSYTLPTEYVFLFVEKRPLHYVQWYFFDGPQWLGNHRYVCMMPNATIYPKYQHEEISEEYAEKSIQYYRLLSDTYAKHESRAIIESKAYKWYTKFSELYPYEMNVFYEDDYFVCYYFKQNTLSPYNLAILE